MSSSAVIASSLFGVAGLLAAAEKQQEVTPPRAQWVVVNEVDEEYAFVRKQRCDCGGRLTVSRQAVRSEGTAKCDVLYCRCTVCDKQRQFYFDVTEMFRKRELASSKSAEAKAYAELDRQYPRMSADQIPQLKQLLRDGNPHHRTWAARHLARLATPGAAEILLDGYLGAGLLDQIPFADGLEKMGQLGLESIEKRLVVANADVETCFRLLALLDRFPVPQAARLTEDQLRQALQSPARAQLARLCYMNLGRLGYKASTPLLLEAERKEAPAPDEALLWAIARCGGMQIIPMLREYSQSEDLRLQATAIAGLGIAGDRASIPRLIELARATKNRDLRHNAVYALGCLRATEAVPVILDLLLPEPKYAAFFCPAGLYGKEDGYTQESCTEVCIHSLRRIGDRRAIPALRRLLQDDQHYLDFEPAAGVAADLGWRELIPDIIDRLERDHEANLRLFGKDHERYAPSLRELTGQKFGEDPKAWRAWQKSPSE